MFYLTTYPATRDSKMMFWTGNMLYNHIEIVCVTCLNILKMGVWMGAMKSLSRTLQPYSMPNNLETIIPDEFFGMIIIIFLSKFRWNFFLWLMNLPYNLTHCGLVKPYGIVDIGLHCCLFHEKPLPGPIITHCAIDPQEQI